MSDLTSDSERPDINVNVELPRRLDQMLETLCVEIERASTSGSPITVPITLMVYGTVVSGTLVSYVEFANHVLNDIEKKLPDPRVCAEMKDRLTKAVTPPHTEFTAANYIHLKDARFPQSSGAYVPGEGVWWRGRLSAVSGFVLG
jgi:hypothetical protein